MIYNSKEKEEKRRLLSYTMDSFQRASASDESTKCNRESVEGRRGLLFARRLLTATHFWTFSENNVLETVCSREQYHDICGNVMAFELQTWFCRHASIGSQNFDAVVALLLESSDAKLTIDSSASHTTSSQHTRTTTMCEGTTEQQQQHHHHHRNDLPHKAAAEIQHLNDEVTEIVHEMQQEEGIQHKITTSQQPEQSKCRSLCNKSVNFYFTYEFLVLVLVAILLARAYPPLGAVYLAPQITATWIAVIFIFVMAGLGLKTSEFTNAFKQFYFNAIVQLYNFGAVSAVVFGFARLLETIGALDKNLADGMIICSCLPMTINMVMVLTKAAGGDEAAAIFNAAFGNMVGVFLSPVLILGYLGVTGDVDLASVFYKLGLRVVLPICVGQVLQKTSKRVVDFVTKYKKYFKKAQMYTLVFIIYTVFCRTFSSDTVSSVGDIFLMILFQFIALCVVMVVAWFLLRILFRNQPELRVMGLFGCTHKTVAMGVPLINAIYDGNPNIGVYTLPLLIWHPMQLVIGSALAPRLEKWVAKEKEALKDGSDEEDQVEPVSTEEDGTTDIEQGKPASETEADDADINDDMPAVPAEEEVASGGNDGEESRSK